MDGMDKDSDEKSDKIKNEKTDNQSEEDDMIFQECCSFQSSWDSLEFSETESPQQISSGRLNASSTINLIQVKEITEEPKGSSNHIKGNFSDTVIPNQKQHVLGKVDVSRSNTCTETQLEISSPSLTALIEHIEKSEQTSKCACCRSLIKAAEINTLLRLLATLAKNARGYECEICTLIMKRQCELGQHVLNHLQRREAYCLKCRTQANSLRRESLFTSSENKIIPEGTNSTGVQPRLKVQMPRSQLKPPRCGRCAHIFDYTLALVHKIVETQYEGSLIRYICHICNFKSVSWNIMEVHVFSHIESEHILCRNCKKD